MRNLKKEVEGIIIEDPEVKKLKETLYLITRQIQNMQFNEEEKTRSDGNSGIKQIRQRTSKCPVNTRLYEIAGGR